MNDPADQRTHFPAHNDDRGHTSTILSSLASLQLSDVHLDSSPIEVQRADALYDFLQMRTSAGKSGTTLFGELWGGRLDGVSGTLGFLLERRVSLMLVTMLISAVGVNRSLLRRLRERGAFRREVFASLHVSCTAATPLPPSRRCRLNGALLDEFLLVTGLAPFFTGDKLAGGTLRNTLRHRRISEWRWELLRAHYTGGLARFVRFGRGERVHEEFTEQHARCTCHRRAARSEVGIDHVVFLPFPRRQGYQPAGTGKLDQPPQAHDTCINAGQTALGTCRLVRGLGSRLKRTVELTKNSFLASKTGVLVYGGPPGQIRRPFAEQANRKLVCRSAKGSFYADRSTGLAAESAP